MDYRFLIFRDDFLSIASVRLAMALQAALASINSLQATPKEEPAPEEPKQPEEPNYDKDKRDRLILLPLYK